MTAETALTADVSESVILDEDRDALHILPIAILPILHPALRRARLLKNPQLFTMVELFSTPESGSGQMTVSGAARSLGLEERPPHPDLICLRKIEDLPSFDVYSLRILLRSCDIQISDTSALRLSPAKIASLSDYMTAFTRPLVAEIFGEDINFGGFTDLISMMRNCPAETVHDRLARMAEKLGIAIVAIPNFLENYGDIFMSLSYYRQCLDQVLPHVQSFLDSLAAIRANYQLRKDPGLMESVDFVERTVNSLTANVTGQLESFQRSTEDMWRDLTAERFNKIEAMVRTYHLSIGGTLCALSVKMNAWQRLFPTPAAGGPMRRAEFIMTDMRQGIGRISALKETGPMLAALQN
jgi:hypothetical protein